MDITVFQRKKRAAPDAREGHAQRGDRDEHASTPCPPCTGRCFQGRACPASTSADPILVALLRRSPLQ